MRRMHMQKKQLSNYPVWFDGTNINEAAFCEEFLHTHKILFANNAFFTPEGRITDDLPLRGEIFESLKHYAINNVPRKVTNILEVMKLVAYVEDFPPKANKNHLANGTLYIDGSFIPENRILCECVFRSTIIQMRPKLSHGCHFLEQLLYQEDIPTLQEFIGYCLIPSNKGQRMMIIKGNGGEGKSQIGAVLNSLLGSNMKDGSIGKISENRFARADLEHILLCVDDDMRMEALKQTSYVKSIVTAQGKMDLERKGKQSYQGWLPDCLHSAMEIYRHCMTGREHIPPRLFKEEAHLTRQAKQITDLLESTNIFNAGKNTDKAVELLQKFFPVIENFQTQVRKYDKTISSLKSDKATLQKQKQDLTRQVKEATPNSIQKKMDDARLRAAYENLQNLMNRIPPEILELAKREQLSRLNHKR